MKPFVAFESVYARLLLDHVDTDQIIPARFLKTTSRDGLGRHAFADWRYDAHGQERADFALNRPDARGASVILAGENFGCGSSREHAPWALLESGVRAVIARSFADIFRQNALKNGLLPIEVAGEALAILREAPAEARVFVDLGTVQLPDGRRIAYPLDPFRRTCLAEGVDEIEYVMMQATEIAEFERRLVERPSSPRGRG
jgi:3-isopropylmalate/(R)-2-methylmalate dehydratase small subunit